MGPGGPHLVPICFALAADVLYSAIDHKPKTGASLRRLENIRHEARVAVLADHYDDDWSRLWWVRADGHARILTEGAERASALELLRSKYPQYESDPPDGPVVAVDIERWSSWAAS